MASTMRYAVMPSSSGDDRALHAVALGRTRLPPVRSRPDADSVRSLATLIRGEIIPRLMMAHVAPASDGALRGVARPIDVEEVDAFAPLVMQVEADALLAQVEQILARGVGYNSIMVDLLAPTARLLGEMWEDDRCDFVDVTMGLWRLQEVVHELAARYPPDRQSVAGGHRALFAAMPGDQHNFGTVVIDELFRREGWRSERVGDAEPAELAKRVADDWFDLVGLTISCDCHTGTLPSLIAALRNVSRNPHVCIMVGGRIFSARPELAAEVGADGTARDARLALAIAEDLVSERALEAAVR